MATLVEPLSVDVLIWTVFVWCEQPEQPVNLLPHPNVHQVIQPAVTAAQSPRECLGTCARHTTCMNCTSEECIWCQNEGRCIDKNAYTASFPYGQCREWTTTSLRCRASDSGKLTPFYLYLTLSLPCGCDRIYLSVWVWSV